MPDSPDTKPIGTPFIELQSVDSTNNYARKRIESVRTAGNNGVIEEGTAIFAHEQTAGRGQREKAWESAPGMNITLSIILYPRFLPLAKQFQLNACVAVSICEFFIKYAGDDTRIKWPNDIYWQDRKAGGVLIESGVGSQELAVGSWQWAIIGIGININQTVFPDSLPNPVSLKQITGKEYDPVFLAKELCGILNKNYEALKRDGFEKIFTSYNENLYGLDQKTKFKKDTRVFEGIIKGVTQSGKLLVHHAIEEEFDFGELVWS